MPLNPYFLQGSQNEQFLVQDLINEQLQTYGVEVYYLPRKVFKTDNIIREVQSSKFDDYFINYSSTKAKEIKRLPQNHSLYFSQRKNQDNRGAKVYTHTYRRKKGQK